MRERIKSVILLGLILSSIALTTRLLFGLPTIETAYPPFYEQLVFGELRPLSDTVQPELRMLREGEWRIIKPWEPEHDDAWKSAKILFLHSQTPVKAEPPAETDESFLWVVFPVAVEPAIWGGAQRLIGLEIDELIWLASEPEAIWYHNKKDGWLKAQLHFLPAEWEAGMINTFITAPRYSRPGAEVWEDVGISAQDKVFLPVERPILAPRLLTQEDLDRDKLVRSIFVDTALVRLIEERDGAYIYTDGQKGLRLFDHGEAEYSAPASEPGLEPMNTIPALRRTAQYLQLMGGWPDHLYLSHLQREENPIPGRRLWDAYTISFFSVQHGIRLVSANPPVKLRFSDRGIIYYNRQVRVLGTETEERIRLIEPLDALKTVSGLLQAESNQPSLVEMFPAYYLRNAPASISSPVWAMSFSDNRTALVHGLTGNFLAWLE
jgi:hypothetical protein